MSRISILESVDRPESEKPMKKPDAPTEKDKKPIEPSQPQRQVDEKRPSEARPDRLESGKPVKKTDAPTEKDKKPIEPSRPQRPLDKKTPSEIKNLSDREKIGYYRKHGLGRLEDNRKAILRSRDKEGKGLSRHPVKMNSPNYDKLAKVRNLTPEEEKQRKESFSKWSPALQKESRNIPRNQILQTPESMEILARRKKPVWAQHAPEGKKLKVAGNADPNDQRSGNYGANGFSKVPEERVEKYAMPLDNTAEAVKKTELARNQNILFGEAGPQTFKKEVGKKSVYITRQGGGRQIVTDGGFAGRDVNGDGKKEPALRYVDEDSNMTGHREK